MQHHHYLQQIAIVKTNKNLRLLAAQVIDAVTSGQSLSDALEPVLSQIKEARDRAFVQAICYGVCRFYTRLDVLLSFLLKKPMKAKDSDVHALLLVGLYQLRDMRVPAHAAVAETVNAAGELNKSWARGFVNANLREYLRQKDKIENEINADLEAQYAHPMWWIDEIKLAWPNNWEGILNANNAHPPFSLRINKQHYSRDEYLKLLADNNIDAHAIPETEEGVVLATPTTVDQLPEFSKGVVSVQDGAAQLAATLLELAPDQRVLDACAAPGGKLAHLLEREPKLQEVVAVEKDESRFATIKDNLSRLKLSATLHCHDVMDVEEWWDGKLFDRILLDAPCSASGVIRRHPDIKLLRESQDIAVLAKLQSQLLEALWPTLKPGGLLLYVTCSLFPAENKDVIAKFLDHHLDAKMDTIDAAWGMPVKFGRQILPGMHKMDGFYYARLRKADLD